MPRPPRLLTSACAAGMLALAVAPWCTTAASADETDGTITVRVVRDENGNGEYDAAVDQPQSGILITVTDVSGTPISGTTDDDGEYVVKPGSELKGGRYFVVADIPASLGLEPVPASDSFQALSTTVDVTSEDQSLLFGVSAPAEPTPVPSTEIPAASAEASPPSDPAPAEAPAQAPAPAPAQAAAPTFAVGDRVWLDADRKGTQNENGAPDLPTSVELLDAGGAVLKSTVTTRDGHYLFDDVPAGVYSVRFSGIPAGFRLSPTGAGSTATDSDPDYTGVTPPFTLGVGAVDVRAATPADHVTADYLDSSIDAGLAPVRYAIASSVWQDTNGDGLQQAGEPAGQARVSLLRPGSDTAVATVSTDASGRYRFENLDGGDYRLKFDDLGLHRQLTAAHVGSIRTVDSDPDPRTGTTPTFTLDQSSTDLVPARDFGPVDADFVDATLNAGVIGRYEIRNRVWNDENGDGLFSPPGESGIPGVQVQVLDAAKAVVATTRTDRDGLYAFTSLPAGSYRLRIRGYDKTLHPTAPGVGGDRNADSDIYADALTAPISVGDDHPVEDAVSVGLTATATTAMVDAPSVAPAASTQDPAAALGATGGGSPAVPVVGSALLLGGGAALWFARRRRRR